jgi:hypothetical protein
MRNVPVIPRLLLSQQLALTSHQVADNFSLLSHEIGGIRVVKLDAHIGFIVLYSFIADFPDERCVVIFAGKVKAQRNAV